MDPRDLPSVTHRKNYPSLSGLRKWWANLGEDTAFGGTQEEHFDQEAALPRHRALLSQASTNTIQATQISPDGALGHPPTIPELRRADALPMRHRPRQLHRKTAVLATSAADKFLGTGVSSENRVKEELPPCIIHPLSRSYRMWWNTTVIVAAITAILEPIVIAFTPPGLYPYNSGTSIVEFMCIVLIAVDMAISFNVARYVNGELVTDRRQLARNYMRFIFWIDLLSTIPFDEIALAIAGLNGPDSVKNPTLAQYLSLLKLIRMLRCYRLLWFFSYLTYNLAAPLLLVSLIRNLFYTFFLSNLSACAFYFEALQAGLGPNTWVGANAAWFEGATSSQMYIYSLYWSVVTMSTTGYGDIRAFNPVEAGLITFWMLFLIFFTAYIIGSITLLIVKGDEQVGKYREEMRALQGYATMHGLPQDLRDSMQRHLKLHFYNAAAADESVLKAYPSSIRRRVLRQLYLPTLRQCYLFLGAKQRFIDALLSVARVELYLPQVEIISQGDYVNEVFILAAGRVACYSFQSTGENQKEDANRYLRRLSSTPLPSVMENSPGLPKSGYSTYTDESVHGSSAFFEGSMRGGLASKTFKQLNDGDVFGEIAFFTGTAQAETVVTLSITRVLAISRSTFEQVAAKFPTSHRIVLTNLARHGEDMAMDQFPGPQGLELFQKAMSEEGRAGGKVPGVSGVPEMGSFTGGDPTWRLAPGHAAALRLSASQEQAVGALLQVQGVVARVVAQHDADQTNEWLYAAARGDTTKLREILTHGIDPNSHDFDHRTALMLAAGRGFRDVVDILLAAGADANTVDTFGGTALMEACKGGHDSVIDALLKAKAKLGFNEANEGSWLCSVVHEGDLKLLRRVLRAGANPNAGDYDGRTALHVAASEGNVPAVEILVNEGGANQFARDRWGGTAIDEADRVGAKAVKMFLVAEAEELKAKKEMAEGQKEKKPDEDS